MQIDMLLSCSSLEQLRQCSKLPSFLDNLIILNSDYWFGLTTKIIKVIGRTVPRNNFLRCLFIFISPLHVSALAGHLQAEYTIFSGSYLTQNGSVVMGYRSYFVYILYMLWAR
jgi:hypothetical protein